MLEIIGETGTSEYSAAQDIYNALSKVFKGIENSPRSEESVKIIASAKLSGYPISDIDIVVCGYFKSNRFFRPTRLLKDTNGKSVKSGSVVEVRNFVVAIEVKDHDASSVQIVGENIFVPYKNGKLKSATDQNIKQLHSLASYFKDLGCNVYVYRCVYMQGMSKLRVSGSISCGFSGEDFLSAIASVSPVQQNLKGYSIGSTDDATMHICMGASIFQQIIPTSLDRRRMDLITSTTRESEILYNTIGDKFVCLRGHGGTGKTIMFLQTAWKLFEQKGTRSLVLTYNHALASDIRRSLGLLRVPSDSEAGGITVSTVMSFIHKWLKEIGVIDHTEEHFLENYDDYCLSAIEMISQQLITKDDINSILEKEQNLLDFDFIFIDESQDWPQNEVFLIKKLYNAKKICIADGIEQLIRGQRSEWFQGTPAEDVKILPMVKSLRMKKNLSMFINSVSDSVRVNWKTENNDMAGGGKIFILYSEYNKNIDLHFSLLNKAKEAGNSEVDFLFCVPPSNLTITDNRKSCRLADSFLENKFDVWNGIESANRKDFPRKKEQLRIVQYASARGLEGWVVVLEHLDDYWQSCYNQRHKEGLTPLQESSFEDIDEVSCLHAWRQVMIALTRPIDTLVITIRNTDSLVAKTLEPLTNKYSEFIAEK